jgi:hypothetical protein
MAKLLVGDRASAEDVVQDVFLNLHRRLPGLGDRDQMLPYLRAAVLNQSRSLLRKRRRAVLRRAPHEPPAASAEAAAMLGEDRRAVLGAVASLAAVTGEFPGPAAGPDPLAAVLYERSPAVDGDDDVALPEDLHRVADGHVGNPVLSGKVSFGGQLPSDFASADPALYVVGDLGVGVFGPVGVNLPRWHKTMVDLL